MASAMAAAMAKSAAKMAATSMVKSLIPMITGKMKEIIIENRDKVCSPEFPNLFVEKVIDKTKGTKISGIIEGNRDILLNFATSLQQS